jgi:hypothetical protein
MGGPESGAHYYRDCIDDDCPAEPCRLCREGQRDGYERGYDAGYVAGEAMGYVDGYIDGDAERLR